MTSRKIQIHHHNYYIINNLLRVIICYFVCPVILLLFFFFTTVHAMTVVEIETNIQIDLELKTTQKIISNDLVFI